jgi:nucleoside-diphosphate-sugar epimerase
MSMAAARGEVLYVGSGETRFTTVHVNDVARLYLLAAKSEKGGVYNATSETNITSKQLAEAMAKVLGLECKGMEFGEVKAKAGAFFANFLSAENRASNEKAKKEFGWEPKETGILAEVESGSYVEVAKALMAGKA